MARPNSYRLMNSPITRSCIRSVLEKHSVRRTNRLIRVRRTKVFHMCWPLSDGSSKFIPIDEQPNHQIVHTFRLGKAQRATNQPLDPGPEIDVLALDFLRVLLAYVMLLDIEMPLIGSPSVGVILCDATGLSQ